jgi:hypothetical protein
MARATAGNFTGALPTPTESASTASRQSGFTATFPARSVTLLILKLA